MVARSCIALVHKHVHNGCVYDCAPQRVQRRITSAHTALPGPDVPLQVRWAQVRDAIP